MVGPGHYLLISKYGTPFSKAVGPTDASFLNVKKNLTLIEIFIHSESTNSTKQEVDCQYHQLCNVLTLVYL